MQIMKNPMSLNDVYYLVNEHHVWKEVYNRALMYSGLISRPPAQKELDAMFEEARKKYSVNFTYAYFRTVVEGYLYALLLYRPANSYEAPLTAVSMSMDIYKKGYLNNPRQYSFNPEAAAELQKSKLFGKGEEND